MRWHLAMAEEDAATASDFRNLLQRVGSDEEVISRWIDLADEDEAQDEAAIARMEDIAKSDGVIIITNRKGSTEVELGLGVAFNKRVVLIGKKRLPMHHLPNIDAYEDFGSFLEEFA